MSIYLNLWAQLNLQYSYKIRAYVHCQQHFFEMSLCFLIELHLRLFSRMTDSFMVINKRAKKTANATSFKSLAMKATVSDLN